MLLKNKSSAGPQLYALQLSSVLTYTCPSQRVHRNLANYDLIFPFM